MTKGGRRRGRERLTPEQEAERFSTDGLRFEDALGSVSASRSDDAHEHGGAEMPTAEAELTDEQMFDVWERTIAGVKDGTLQTFDDKDAFITDALRRLRR
jgi:hypothetical protein